MIYVLAIALWFGYVVCITGPAFEDRRRRKRLAKVLPRAQLMPGRHEVLSVCGRDTCRCSELRFDR